MDNFIGQQTERNNPSTMITRSRIAIDIDEDIDESMDCEYNFSNIEKIMSKLPSVKNFTPGKFLTMQNVNNKLDK